MKCPDRLLVLALAALLTALNALKPVMMDDTAYYQMARQIVRAPADPYGFEQYWYDQPQPAHELLAPPVFPYWFALSLAVFGDDPVAWKLALFPFALLLVLAVRALADRFAQGLTPFVLPLAVLSPALLPGFNLMLDVPALALSLAAVALFLRAVERESAWGSVLAGLVAGLAMQTKYTALVTPVVLLAHAVLRGRPGLGFLATGTAAVVFIGWELYTAHLYGISHFWFQVTRPGGTGLPRTRLMLPLVAYLGGLLPAVTLLGLVGLRWRKLALAWAGWVILGHVLLALVPAEQAVFLHGANGRDLFSLNSLLFGSLGLGMLAVTGAVLVRCLREPGSRFLAVWFVVELAGYFALSPFPAARRVMGLAVVTTLLAGRLAVPLCRDALGRCSIALATTLGVALGLGYFTLDCTDAHLEPAAAQEVSAWIRQRDADGTAWFLGTWGLKFYAERLGMRHLVPGRSEVRPGDWLVLVPRDGTPPAFRPPPERFAWRGRLEVASPLPLHTYSGYYGGHRPLDGGRPKTLVIDLYQARPDGTPPAGSPETAPTAGRTEVRATDR